ncbi:MAG: hypothetical protein KF745_14060 [Phycisphaeraceae bacterium]|nr:hypothetical protein [Phycisphaeraceae bacterium]
MSGHPPSSPSPHQRWPADRFYWAVLEAPGWRRTGPLPEALRPDFEDLVPRAAAGAPLHAVCTPAADTRVVVCAVPMDALASLPVGVLRLSPESLPSCIDAAVHVDHLDLLVGDAEPAPIRRARLRRHLAAMALVLALASLAAIGLLRRAAHWTHAADLASAAAREALEGAGLDESHLDLAQRLAEARQFKTLTTSAPEQADAAGVLAEILALWPSVPGGPQAKPQSLAITDASITASVLIEGSPTPFLDAFAPPPGWALEEPRLSTQESFTRVSITLRRGDRERAPSSTGLLSRSGGHP